MVYEVIVIRIVKCSGNNQSMAGGTLYMLRYSHFKMVYEAIVIGIVKCSGNNQSMAGVCTCSDIPALKWFMKLLLLAL